MFLVIFEDGVVMKTGSFTDDLRDGVDSGYIDALNIYDQHYPTQYIDGEWVQIQPVVQK